MEKENAEAGKINFCSGRKNRKRWYRAVSILSCFVVFCTVYALILPAITMEKQTYCGEDIRIHLPVIPILMQMWRRRNNGKALADIDREFVR